MALVLIAMVRYCVNALANSRPQNHRNSALEEERIWAVRQWSEKRAQAKYAKTVLTSK